MERLSKIAIYLGMFIASSVFVLVLISILPHVVDTLQNNWDDILPGKSDEDIKSIFYETKSYKTFVNKYPENGKYYDSYGNGYGSLKVTSMNFDSYNTLKLELHYDRRTDSVKEEVTCYNQADNRNYRIKGTLTTQFIEKIDCLNGPGNVAAPSPLIDEDGNPVNIEVSPKYQSE